MSALTAEAAFVLSFPGARPMLPSFAMYHCHACGGELEELVDKVKRADTCDHCGADLHCCKNCRFYDPYAHNGCRESSTLYEPDKERANFCTHFTYREGAVEKADKGGALSALDALFKKKT